MTALTFQDMTDKEYIRARSEMAIMHDLLELPNDIHNHKEAKHIIQYLNHVYIYTLHRIACETIITRWRSEVFDARSIISDLECYMNNGTLPEYEAEWKIDIINSQIGEQSCNCEDCISLA